MTTGGRIQYALLMGACRITGMFPNRLLYHALAPFICFVLHRIVRYRLTVVRTNLSNSFPEKSAAELREIETKFYRHLSEVFVDTIKLATISRKEILERMVYRDVEAQEEAMRGRNWISAMSHYGSWELTINYPATATTGYWPSTARCTARRSTSSTTKPDPVSARSRFR